MGVDQYQWWDIQGYGPNIFVPMDCDGRVPFPYNFPWLDAPCLPWHREGPLCKRSFGKALAMVRTGLRCSFPKWNDVFLFPTWLSLNLLSGIPQKAPKHTSPGIHVLIQHGRFDAESRGAADMDEILSGVYASKRETCSKHGCLGWPQYGSMMFPMPLETKSKINGTWVFCV